MNGVQAVLIFDYETIYRFVNTYVSWGYRPERAAGESLADNLTRGVQHADVMGPITEIQAEGEPTHDGSR